MSRAVSPVSGKPCMARQWSAAFGGWPDPGSAGTGFRHPIGRQGGAGQWARCQMQL